MTGCHSMLAGTMSAPQRFRSGCASSSAFRSAWAIGTRGRDLLDGARHLKMHGRYVAVRCEVVSLSDYSVHADADELVSWLTSGARTPETYFVVHGEPTASASLAARITRDLGWCAVVPRLGEKVRLD